MNKIPEGYKQTEIGVIPSDWEKKLMDEVSISINSGKSKTKSELGGNFPIYGSTGIIGFSSKFDYEGDRLLIARVGANAGTVNLVDYKYCVSDNTLMVRLQKEIDFLFIFYFLNYSNLNKLIFGSGQPLITGTQLKNLPIPLPPTKSEQTAIATALNDTDNFITQLEKLIAKKRNIKQGAMQELLKPKDGWEVRKLGELFELNPSKPLIKQEEIVIFLGMEDISEEGRITNQHLILFSQIKKGLTFFKKNDVIVAKITPCFENGKGVCLDTLQTINGFGSTEFHVLRINEKSVPRFVFYHTQTQQFRKKLEPEMTGTAGQKRVPSKSIVNYQVSVPPLQEQTRIAQILSDMDAEIEALEKKLDKYKMIKQGMMENLLTGKIRLV
ncbi:MAG: restriction endonuclease subunit S [Desulfobacterales bacterium]|nr:restriction endonuclease subunit S [Desulfobacterales bacterium]